jgi:peptide/nickel transport system permease protein
VVDLSLRGYIARRLVYTVVLVVFVIVLNWLIFQVMPGEQGSLLALQGVAGKGGPSQTQYDYYIKQYGLNKSPWDRFAEYFVRMITLNFGTSFQTHNPVMQAMFFILALSVIIANFACDLIYGIIDPRIKYD